MRTTTRARSSRPRALGETDVVGRELSIPRPSELRCLRPERRLRCAGILLRPGTKEELGMAVAMFTHWPGMSADQYDALVARLDLDANPAAGMILHLAALTDDGLEVSDVWQTEQAFHGFLEHRLMPLVQELQLTGEPETRVVPLHNLFVADGEVLDRIGLSSLPAGMPAWVG